MVTIHRAAHVFTDRLSAPKASALAAFRTAVCVLKVLPMLPSRPIDWLTPAPVREQVRYPSQHGEVEAEIAVPSSKGPHPGIVVCLGVVPFGVDHPQVPRLQEALTRAGFATLLYWSSDHARRAARSGGHRGSRDGVRVAGVAAVRGPRPAAECSAPAWAARSR